MLASTLAHERWIIPLWCYVKNGSISTKHRTYEDLWFVWFPIAFSNMQKSMYDQENFKIARSYDTYSQIA